MKSGIRVQRATCFLLILLAGLAFLFTFLWPVLSPFGGTFIMGASLFFSILLWVDVPDSEVLPARGGDEDDR